MKRHPLQHDVDQVRNAEKWLEDHGKPKYEELIRLAKSPYIEDKEQLRELAELYDLGFDTTQSPETIAEQIWTAMDDGANQIYE
jgi:hypothetical protein